MKIKKCKIDVKEKGGKLVMSQRGYCDEKNPNQIVNRDIEMNMGNMMKSMDKVMSKFEDFDE